MATFYNTGGTTLRKFPDGSTQKAEWRGIAGETAKHAYHAYRYLDTGECRFAVNCIAVDALPDTPVARETFSRFLDLT